MTYVQPDPVILVDSSGNPYTASGGGGGTTDMTATNTKLDALHTDLTGSLTTQVKALTVTGSLSATGAIDGSTDLSNYSSVSLQISGTYNATLLFEVSNDGVSWAGRSLTPVTITTSFTASVNALVGTSTGIWVGDIGAKFFRVRVSAYTSGTMTATLIYRAAPFAGQVSLNPSTQFIGGVYVGSTTAPSAFSTIAAATTNATSVKTSAGLLYSVSISNPTSSPVFLKVYNKASAPTVGTDVPVLTIPIAANGYAIEEFGANGMRLATGIAWALTGAMIATDATAVTAGAQVYGTYS